MIDLRSDTITRPTSDMRKAMAEADVGDAVFGEDPTVNELEARTAEILGKEAAAFMPSGTMTNQVALRAHTEPGDEIIIEEQGHVYYYEGGGSIWPMERIEKIAILAKEKNLSMHLDGARLWNASATTGIAEKEYAQYFDSISLCFSKGLGAPVGSALCGSSEFIKRARRFMKQFGGYMRQAGIIAAGALYALKNHRERLTEDHANAKLFAQGLTDIPGIELDVSGVETNMVMFGFKEMTSVDLMLKAHEAGVLVLPSREHTVRAVTSMAVSQEDVQKAVDLLKATLKK